MKPNRTTDQINLRLDPDWLDAARGHAKGRGEDLTAFLRRAIAGQMERDNLSDNRRYALGQFAGQVFVAVPMEVE